MKTSETESTESKNTSSIPQIVSVDMTALLENSVNDQVSNSDIEGMGRIIQNKEYLKRNIDIITYSDVSTWRCRDKTYSHRVQFRGNVKTDQLWEGARSYLILYIFFYAFVLY